MEPKFRIFKHLNKENLIANGFLKFKKAGAVY